MVLSHLYRLSFVPISKNIHTWHHLTIQIFSACNIVEEARAGSPVPSTSTEADEPSSPTLETPFIESLIKYSLLRIVSRIAPLNFDHLFACTQ